MHSGIDTVLAEASALLQQNKLDSAEQLVERELQSYPDSDAFWALSSEISLRRGSIEKAWSAIERATELNGGDPRRHVQRARCAILADRIDAALEAVNNSLALGVVEVNDLLTLASVLVRCNENGRALDVYRQVEKLDSGNVHLWRGVASVHRFLGDIVSAEGACDKALSRNRHDYETQHLRSSLRTQTRDDNHVNELESLLQSGVRDWRGAVQLSFALAKELEDLERFEESFKYLASGAILRRQNLKYNLANDLAIFPAIQEAFSRSAIEKCKACNSGEQSNAPIFVLGLPRSGSTLVERIISSHSAVSTAGELNDFAIELVSLVQQNNDGKDLPRLSLPKATLQVDMEQFGANYVQAAQGKAGDTRRFIDKLPLNSLYVGLIHLAVPNAKIVHVHRKPMDACYAMLKFLFKNGYPFSYDLKELGEYYSAHYHLMQHWRDSLPSGSMFELCYEDLVSNQEGVSRALLEYLGLDWEEECLDFHRNEHASTTGSATQVRQPIYRSSVEKWRRYGKQLQPLSETLEKCGIVIV